MNSVLSSDPSLALEILRQRVRGDLLAPGDLGFLDARSSWNLNIDHSPACVVVPTDASDVQAAVDFARELGMPIAVQATGHGQPRHCVEGVLIQTGKMNSVDIDVERRTARIGAGARWHHVLPRAQEHGLCAVSGSATHVGVVGYTLGGGYGLLSRELGLAIDSVLSIQVVTADGKLRTASATENPDLFWALRGGGGGFGVVTEIEIALHPGSTVFGGMTVYPASALPQVLRGYIEWVEHAPNEVTTALNLFNFPPAPTIPEPLRGRQVVAITACAHAEADTAIQWLAPLRSLAVPIVDTMSELPYAESGAICQDPVEPMPSRGRGAMLDTLTLEVAEDLMAAIGPLELSPNLKIEIRHLGGAASSMGATPSPLDSHRGANHFVYMVGVTLGPNTPERIDAQATRVIDALGKHLVCNGTLNFLGEGSVSGEAVKDVFAPEDWSRLVDVKRAYDPQNLFRYSSVGIAFADGVA